MDGGSSHTKHGNSMTNGAVSETHSRLEITHSRYTIMILLRLHYNCYHVRIEISSTSFCPITD